MGESSKAAALRIARAAFEGLAPLLIESGITSPEAEGLLRSVYVHETARAQGVGRRTNVSRISVKTGVDRHTVANLLKTPPSVDSTLTARRDSTSRVVDGWLSDPEYTAKGSPQALEIGDPNTRGRNVWNLARRYAPGVWPRLIIDEMIRVDYVESLPGGRLRLKPSVTPKLLSKVASRDGSQWMRDAIRSLYRDATQNEKRRTWRTAQSSEIEEEDLPLVRKMLRDRLDAIFAWLTEELDSTRWRGDGSRGGAKVRIGLSGFTFEEPLPKDVGNESRRKVRRRR